MASRVHLFKKSAIEAGTPDNYYLDPSEDLMNMTSEWKAVELEDSLTVKVNMLGFGDLVFSGVEGKFISLAVALEKGNRLPADKKCYKIEMNQKFLKKAKGYGNKTGSKAKFEIPKKKVSGFLMAPKIYLLKKSAIEARARGNYYLKPSEKMMKMASEWSVVEDEEFVTVTINHDGFGDQVFVSVKNEHIHIDVAKENKEKTARFGFKDGMKDLKIKMNYNFMSSKALLYITEGSTKVSSPKDRAHTGVFVIDGMTITC